jgi:hypothetical protein
MTKVFVALAIDRMKPKIARFDRERMMAYLYGRTVV